MQNKMGMVFSKRFMFFHDYEFLARYQVRQSKPIALMLSMVEAIRDFLQTGPNLPFSISGD